MVGTDADLCESDVHSIHLATGHAQYSALIYSLWVSLHVKPANLPVSLLPLPCAEIRERCRGRGHGTRQGRASRAGTATVYIHGISFRGTAIGPTSILFQPERGKLGAGQHSSTVGV